jgi:hypothetical protein
MKEVAKNSGTTFLRSESYVSINFLTKMDWTIFWAIFSQTHPVTLLPGKGSDERGGERNIHSLAQWCGAWFPENEGRRFESRRRFMHHKKVLTDLH